MMRNKRISAKLALAIAAACAPLAKGDITINNFDDSDSAAEVAQWSFAYGNGSFTSNDATLSFSTDDANGSSTSGSLDVLLNFAQTAADQAAAITRGNLGGLNASTSGILMMDFDLKAVAGSATDQFGQSGFFNLFHTDGPSFSFVSDYGDNLHPNAGWIHLDVPVGTPNDSINSLVAQVYDNGSASAFPGPNGLVEFRMDNVKFITTPPPPPPPGISRAGHQNSFESTTEIDSTHPGGQSAFQFKWGDSYSSSATNNVDHTQSNLYPTDGSHTLRLSQAMATDPNNGTYGVDTQVQYSSSNPDKWNTMLRSTKMLLDVTTPAHGPGYQTLECDLNFGHYISSYGTSGYQFVDGNPGGANTRTTALTQTYTWDYGSYMLETFGQLWPGISNYNFFHFATGNGGAAVGDPSPDATAEYFLDNLRLVSENVTTTPTWQTIGTADWNSANWGTIALATDSSVHAVSAPNGAGTEAIFYGYGAGTGTTAVNSTVTVSSAITVGSIVFDSQMTSFNFEGSGISASSLPQIVNYTLSGTGSLTLDSGTNTSEIYAIAGSHSINVPVLVNSNLEVDTSAGFTADTGGSGRPANVAMTSLSFNAPIALANGVTFTTHGAGTVNLSAVTGTGGGLVVYGGHTNLNGNVNVGTMDVTAIATAAPGGSVVIRTGALTVEGTLDLSDNHAIVDYTGTSPLSSIRDAIHSAYNGGSWNGVGITSGNAATIAAGAGNTHATAIGFAEASSLGVGSFAGQSVDTSAILMRYTFAGDANLDGKVNALDFNAVARNFGATGKFWTDADFNYDGTVNTSDFTIMASNFGQVMAAPALGTLVPEPSAIALVGLGLATLGRRRRQLS